MTLFEITLVACVILLAIYSMCKCSRQNNQE